MFTRTNRAVSIIVLITLYSHLLVSCNSNKISPAEDIPVGLLDNIEYARTIEIDQPGEMHNDMLNEFYKRRGRRIRDKIPAPEFTEVLMASVNTVLEKENILIRISRKDVLTTLKSFVDLNNEGMMDVFNPTREDLIKSFDIAVDKGIITASASQKYLSAILAVDEQDKLCALKGTTHKAPITDQDDLPLHILNHSHKFWSEVPPPNFAIHDSDTITPNVQWWAEKIASYGTDVLWGAIGIFGAPASAGVSLAFLLTSTAASIAMDCYMGEFIDWLNGELSGV